MDIKERITSFIRAKNLTIRAFEIKCGLSNGYIGSMRKGIGHRAQAQIAEHFPELNIAWLLTGEGEMLKPPKNEFSQVPQNVMKETLTQEVVNYVQGLFESGKAYHASAVKLMLEEKDKEIERLREENRKMQEEITNLKTKRRTLN